MANQRQRLARKRFRLSAAADGVRHLNAKENSSLENVAKRKKGKKTIGEKRRRVDKDEILDGEQINSRDVEETGQEDYEGVRIMATDARTKVLDSNEVAKKDIQIKKKSGSKHPLRIQGMKPGEGCFMCKASDHIAKFCPKKNERDRKKICLLCRKVGHTLKTCPQDSNGQETKFCYNCGENGHRLAECKQPIKNGGTSFAECFLCKMSGHLSKNCPTNSHGIYPKGGSCKLCGGVTHLAKDCPQKASGRMKLKISTGVAKVSQPGAGGRTVFKSGDDLEDDFGGETNANVGSLDFGSNEETTAFGLEQESPEKSIPRLLKKSKNEVLHSKSVQRGDKQNIAKKANTSKIVQFQQ